MMVMAFFVNGTRKARMEEKKDAYQELMDKNIPVERLSDEEVAVIANKARDEIAAQRKK